LQGTSQIQGLVIPIGGHTVTLIVTDDDFATGSDSATVIVNAVTSNQPPVANAGDDQTVIDNDVSGAEMVILDGRASTDDGSIASYEWREGATLMATGSNPMFPLAVGPHTIELTVTDNIGATSTDTVDILVQAPPPIPTGSDFKTQLVKLTIPAGSSSVTSFAFDGVDSSRTVALISGITQQAMGWTAETTQDPVEISAYVELSGDGSSITATRASAMNQTDTVWVLLIEYTGSVGGANELLVRDRSVQAWSSGQASTSYGPIGFVGNGNNVVVFGAGSSNSNTASSNYDRGDVRAWLDNDNNVQ
jgi:hypothetical protein